MRKRRLLMMLIGLACLTLLALGGLAMLGDDDPRVSKRNVDRITQGMTVAQVQEILGKNSMPFHGYVGKDALCWQNDDRSYAIVLFDDDAKVAEKAQWGASPETIGAKIVRWARRWWK